MRNRFLIGSFLVLVLAVAAVAGFAELELRWGMDRYVGTLVSTELSSLKSDVLTRLQQEGWPTLPPAPPPPSGTPVGAAPVPDEARLTHLVQETVANYRLGHSGYAWLYSLRSRQWLLLRLDLAGIPTDMVASDRQQVPALLTQFEEGGEKVDEGAPRYVAFTRLPQDPDLVLGITYPISDVAPLIRAWRGEVGVCLGWVLAGGLLLLAGVARVSTGSLSHLVHLADRLDTDPGAPRLVGLPSDVQPVADAVYRLAFRLQREGERRGEDVHSLTGLPGRQTLTDELFFRIDAGGAMAVGLVDAVDFLPFNAEHGYPQGDKVLQFMAGLVAEAVAQAGGPGDQAYYLEADRFVFVTTPERADAIAAVIVREFDLRIPLFYRVEEREKGCMVVVDRQGQSRTYPIMKVTVGIVTNERHPLLHPLQIASICTELCDFLKQGTTSGVMRDRRSRDRDGLTTDAGHAGAEA